MMKKTFITILTVSLTTLTSCSQNKSETVVENTQKKETETKEKQQPHKYGGWYCPDNLNGFPAVDIANWDNVPVINKRLPTKEETRSESSLLYIDLEKYPNAKPLDMTMPRLARYYNEYTKKNELIIIIQAVNVQNDSVVGFRYLNGGNGSAWLNEVKFLSDNEIENLTSSSFVTLKININASNDSIWDVLTNSKYAKTLQPIFDKENKLDKNWKDKSKANFKYINSGIITSEVATNVWGNLYIQIDYDLQVSYYVEKILLLENENKKSTELNLVFGPYGEDFEEQKEILTNWVEKVKELSEAKN